jgi:serine/threonine-protein kinase
VSAGDESEVKIPPGVVVLDKYRVVRMLGVGGMGFVVQATHITLGTQVAIKFLLPQFAVMGDAARRFVREAQAASKITSDHIVRVFDTGTSTPYGPFIVMEFLEGFDLARHIRQRGGFPVDEAVDYAVQAALALGEAHASGIVHRDVKPANLFVVERSDGSHCVKVLDFGISKVAEESSLEVTKTSAILGSGLYMSPEQMRSAKNVDHRTDMYALGISLYELLTRTQPFTAESFPELVIKVNMEPPVDLRHWRPDVPPELAEVIGRAYAKKPEDRYQTMAELAAALAPWAAASTRQTIDKIARIDARRRAGSSPSLPAFGNSAAPAPLTFDADVRIPRPAPVPSPASVGVDTFGLSKQSKRALSSVDPLGQTASKSFSGTRSRPTASLLGVGIGLGIAASVAAVAVYYARSAPNEATPLQTAEAAAPASERPTAETAPVVVPTGDPSVAATGSAAPSIPTAPRVASAKAPSPSAAPTASAITAEVASAAVAATAAPTATPTSDPAVGTTGEPCYIRDLDGTMKPCPE